MPETRMPMISFLPLSLQRFAHQTGSGSPPRLAGLRAGSGRGCSTVSTLGIDTDVVSVAGGAGGASVASVDRAAVQRVTSGQNFACALAPTTRPTCPAPIAIDVTSRDPTWG